MFVSNFDMINVEDEWEMRQDTFCISDKTLCRLDFLFIDRFKYIVQLNQFYFINSNC